MKYFVLPAALLFTTTVAPVSPVMAEPYLGLGVGAAMYKADLSSFGASNLDENNTGFKFFGGYAFDKYFAVEADYYNFTEASGGVQISGMPVASAMVSMDGVAAFAVATYPVYRELNLMAKLGVMRWRADLTVNSNTASNDGTNAAYGIGASFAFTKDLLATIEWEYFDTDNPELSMFSAGFRVNFR
jgi:OOP family OmpA-OmpF porin